MPVIELVFPPLKPNAELLAELAPKKPAIFKHFLGINGLKTTFQGSITEDAGKHVEENSGRTAIVLEWDNPSSFHNFFPRSPQFQAFVTEIKPYLAGPATPELYETAITPEIDRSICVMQLVKAPIVDGVREAWKSIEDGLKGTNARTYSAEGIEANEGVFLGIIGWQSVEEYERHGKDGELLEGIKRIGGGGEGSVLVVELSAVEDA